MRVLTAIQVFSALLLLASGPGLAWTRGAHDKHWKKGQTIKICVDKPPAEILSKAVDEAIREWNEAQTPFGGLKLETATEPCDVKIHWKAMAADEGWGQTTTNAPPLDVNINTGVGSNEQGYVRTLKHELGHVEGLGHSEQSDVMRDGSTKKQKNDPGPIKGPNDDDKAGKKAMYGTVEKETITNLDTRVDRQGQRWSYTYSLATTTGPRMTQPVTQLTLTFPPGVTRADIAVMELPARWGWKFYAGGRKTGAGIIPEDRNEPPPPPSLSFTAPSPDIGVKPGQTVTFRIQSLLPPVVARAFTNSPAFDSDEFGVQVPGRPINTRRNRPN